MTNFSITSLYEAERFCNNNDLNLDLRDRDYGCAAYATGNNEFIREHPQSRKRKDMPWLEYEIRLGGFEKTVTEAWDDLSPPNPFGGDIEAEMAAQSREEGF